jgi:hypothetical protein
MMGAGPKWAVGMGTEIAHPSGAIWTNGSGGIEITLLTATAGHTMPGNRPISSVTHQVVL